MLKKDILELCLLRLIAERDLYGYELLNRLYAAFPTVQESMVYAYLRGLCREGCTETYQSGASGGPTRKYYRLTDNGREKLADLLRQWRETREALLSLGIE